jgi:acyl-CoA dehydrogenase
MNLTLKQEDLEFRNEVRQFLQQNLGPDLQRVRRSSHAIGEYHEMLKWQKILHAKGWVAPAWPEQYGGPGWTDMQRYIFSNECTMAGAPSLPPFGLGMCGPVLMEFGTDEQKSHYLPRILSAEDYWCQGYSEPGSGSDLASLKTRAVTDGDDYIVNGQKIWTTHAHHATNIFLLVRTDTESKPQAGISFLLLDMDMPGIRVEPIITLAGEHEVNEVFFDDVRVPRSRLVGQENQGWTIAKYLLQFERSASYAAGIKHIMADIHLVINEERSSDGVKLSEDSAFMARLSELQVSLLALDTTERIIMSALSTGQNPGAKTSMMKAAGTELMQAATELNMQALAYYSIPAQNQLSNGNAEPIGPDYAATPTACYLNDRAASIYAGSNEVQRNILAQVVLGL